MSRTSRMPYKRILMTILVCASQAMAAQQPVTIASRSDREAISSTEVLARPVTLDVSGVPLATAIKAVAAQAKVVIAFRETFIDQPGHNVTLKVTRQPLGGVLEKLLAGTNLRVVVVGPDAIALRSDSPNTDRMADGAISGTVTNANTRQAVRGATVVLDDSTGPARTDESGHYRFPSVRPGSHKVSVRSIGFARQQRIVTVTDGQTASADFALESSVSTLDQVVVTATGAQRYRELGHVVTQLNADSLVRSAPITTFAELLTARVPGLQVFTGNGGIAGGDVALQLRGPSTLNLDPQPIVIIDGVRYKSTNTVTDKYNNGGDGASVMEDMRAGNVLQRSPLNDLNVNDIETVEVVKGPSASTLYGPDAASGVIVITTKRGQVGKPKWGFYVHPNLATLTHQANRPTVGYWGWGHDPSTGEQYLQSCTLVAQYYGQCVQDSITIAPTAEGDPDLAVIAKQRPQWQSGVNVSGGADMFRYYFSGGYDSQTGSLQIPPTIAEALVDQLGKSALTDAIRDPNSQQMVNLRSNISADLTPITSLQLSMGYTRTLQRQINISAYQYTVASGPLRPGCTGLEVTDACAPNILGYFISPTQLNGNRFTGSLGGTVRPTPWFTVTGNFGMDLDGSIDRLVVPSTSLSQIGAAEDYRRSNTDRTGRLNATARAHPGRLSFQTSVGTDYHYTQLDGLDLSGRNLAPGSTSISTAQELTTNQLWSEVVSLGTYGEEIVGLNDRLFLTGSLRYDGSTSFGDAYHARPFPKAGVSWIASDEPFLKGVPGLDQLRFRYSYGASSRYPTSMMKTGEILPGQVRFGDSNVNSIYYQRDLLANPLVRPERTRESEYGMDATVLSGRVDIGLTWYRRRVNSVLQLQTNPTGLAQQWANVGDIASHGREMTVTARVVDSRLVQATLRLTGSFDTNKLLSVGMGNGSVTTGSIYVGYPLGAIFNNSIIGVADTVGGVADSVVLQNEVVFGPLQYQGLSTPPRTYTLTPSANFWGGRLRIATEVDRSTGFIVPDAITRNGLTDAALRRGTPLLAQAYAVAGCCEYSPGDYTRWRELSISTDLPDRLAHLALLSRGTVSFYVRNLALWTHDKAGDPESLQGQGITAVGTAGNILQVAGIAQPRSWSISFDFVP